MAENLITLQEARQYLRLDSADENTLVAALLSSSIGYCADIARLTEARLCALLGTDSWDGVISDDSTATGDSEESTISEYDTADEGSEESEDAVYTSDELSRYRGIFKASVLYCLAYLFEHREDADHHALAMTLRNLLFSLREDLFT